MRAPYCYWRKFLGIFLLLFACYICIRVSSNAVLSYNQFMREPNSVTGNKWIVREHPETFFEAIVYGRLLLAAILATTGLLILFVRKSNSTAEPR